MPLTQPASIRFDQDFVTRDFYIHATNGSNTNYGDAARPLATLSEVARRLHGQKIEGTINIYLQTPITDNSNFVCDLGKYVLINVYGTKTTVGTGTITAVQAFNTTTRVDQQLTASGLPVSWTASGFVGKMIKLTSGSHSGAFAWVYEDLGSKVARVSPFFDADNFAVVTPSVNDQFTVYTVPKITGSVHGDVGAGIINFYDIGIEYVPTSYRDIVDFSGGAANFIGCDLNGRDQYPTLTDYGHVIFSGSGAGGIYGCWGRAHIRNYSHGALYSGANLYTTWGTAPTADGVGSEVINDLPSVGYGEQTYMQGRNGGKVTLNDWYMVANQTWGLVIRDTATAVLNGKLWGFGITLIGVLIGAAATIVYGDDMQPDLVDSNTGPTYPGKQIDLGGDTITYSSITNTVGAINADNDTKIYPIYFQI